MAKISSKRIDRQATSTSTFMLLSGLAALALAAVAAVLYLRNAPDSGMDAQEFALLSQAIPRHAANAVSGKPAELARLESDLGRLSALRQNVPASELPGGAEAWTGIEQRGSALLANRDHLRTIRSAAAWVSEHMPETLQASNALLEVSGATAVIREFQQRGQALAQELEAMAAGKAEPDAATRLSEQLSFMTDVTGALSGAETGLDVTPLGPEAQAALQPVVNGLSEIEMRVESALTASASLGDPDAELAGLTAAADGLYDAILSGTAAASPQNFPASPWVPLALIGLALLLLAILAWMHSRTAVFERASKEQTEQNERNQQAILRLLDELGSLADGDLTVEATVTEDITGAIADSINYAIEKLRELVATINETAIMVDSAAKQTESTASHMARAADNQNREIRAASESIESMAASIEEVSGNAERSSDVARHSVEVAHKGGEAVRRTIDGMNTIRETIQETSKRIKRLGESSQEIGNIVELINDIAEQTNILALNASIQASMAGEAGRGFAVVADEVQRLAERSTNATKQIEVLVRTIQSDTNEAVVSMERSTTDVVGGALLAENAGAALDEIEQVSNQIASLVQNISGSARQQAGSAADVTRRTAKLKEISEAAGKATSATAAAVSKLSVLASQLRQTVAGFTLPSSAFNASALSARRARHATTETEDRAAG
ncbi:MAG TPA: methyl-accepting chemotaxis protein [Woeseiaceae bacterium]|nr:methyl-accepting chemotaxis protein [Woeseiaceae bacterium]